MKILKVIPVTKIPFPHPQELSYFSLENVALGALVLIELKHKDVLGLVTNVRDLQEEKMMVRQAKFSLKKIKQVVNPQEIIDNNLRKLIIWASLYYWESLGLLAKTILPHRNIKRWQRFKQPAKLPETRLLTPPKKVFYSHLSLSQLIKLCREALARKQQVLILYPEILKLEKATEKMNQYFKNKILVVHSATKRKELWSVWQKVWQGDKAIIMATRQGVFLPFSQLGLIIITDEESLSYKSWGQHPKINARHLGLKLAEIHQSNLILTSLSPSIESYWNISQKRYKAIQKPFKRTAKYGKIRIVDMTIKNDSQRKKFSYFSPLLKKEIVQSFQEKKKIVLFQNRRGSATYIFCQTCGYFFQCPHCRSSLVYHQDKQKLICHWCGHQENPPSFCPRCGGYHLKYSGHGTQKVKEELKQLFPKADAYLLDNDATPTYQDKQRIWRDFYQNQQNAVLITTASFFSLPLSKIDLIAFLNFDLITNFPDFRANEKAIQIIIKSMAFSQTVILQTYNPNSALLKRVIEKKYDKIYKEELNIREKFQYPPFWQLINLRHGSKNETAAKRGAENLFKELNQKNRHKDDLKILGPMPSSKSKKKNYYYRTIVLKIKRGKLKQRNNLLSLVPPNWDIDVDPLEI